MAYEISKTGATAPTVNGSSLMAAGFTSGNVAREVALVQGQIATAKMFPRDEGLAIQRIEQACSRPTLASQAVYEFARGGTSVHGASIRLAEAMAKAWGNINYGMEEQEAVDGVSKVRAFAFDKESNTQAERTFLVSHMRHTNKGDYKLTDPRDIYELIANQGARRVRACLLEILPSDIVEYALDLCAKTNEANVSITPDTTEKLINAFTPFGISKASIEEFIQRKVEAITTSQYLRLKEIYTSLKDGVAKPEDFFNLNAGKEEKKEAKKSTENKAKTEEAKTTPEINTVSVATDYNMETGEVDGYTLSNDGNLF